MDLQSEQIFLYTLFALHIWIYHELLSLDVPSEMVTNCFAVPELH